MKTTLVALSALTLAGGAYAQNGASLAGTSLRLGMAFPINNTLSGFGDNFTGFGFELPTSPAFGPAPQSYLAFDYIGKSLGEFGKGSALVISYNLRFRDKTGTARAPYAYIGAGYASLNFGASTDGTLAFRGGFGMDLSDHTFAEIGGTFSSSTASNGAFNTIGLSVGYRF